MNQTDHTDHTDHADARPAGATIEPVEPRRLPELLAPAGDWNCARAAVENGADAIYFGLDRFNARMRAHNFTEADLPALMEFLHRRGVKGYVTFNTLLFQDELAEAEQYLRAIIAAGVDAAIVQDVGICRLIRTLSPDFPIHASTQMTVTSAAGVAFARQLGCSLVVLARECSLKEICKIQETFVVPPEGGTTNGPPEGGTTNGLPEGGTANGLPLEVFVHGALCVAYSGQCLTSEALGGRSANRGECAQACRMPYDLIADGRAVPLGDRKYLLSPQDLAGLEVLADLVGAGVVSLKIEGRLKTPEYVANITRVYRQALDRLRSQSRDLPVPEVGSPPPTQTRQPEFRSSEDWYELEMAFSRGLYTGWLGGINNQQLVHARFGKKRGVFLGEVSRVEDDQVFLKIQRPLKPGDGVVFDAGHPEQPEEGGRVYEVRSSKLEVQGSKFKVQGSKSEVPALTEVALTFGRGDIDFSRVHPGDKVWKTSDPELDRRLRQSYDGDLPKHQRPLRFEARGRAGQPLTLIARDELGHVVQVASAQSLAVADKQPLTAERLGAQLGRLGATPFRLAALNNRLEGQVILPISELNRLRREVVMKLEALRARPKRWTCNPPALAVTSSSLPANPPVASADGHSTELIVLARTLPQLEAALLGGATTLYCDFENPKTYRDAVRLARDASQRGQTRKTIWVAPPRIFKTGEEWILNQVRACEADGYLVRNYDHLKFFAGDRRVGDFSLNVANALAADYFKNAFGLERLTASYDLNAAQLAALLRAAPAEWFEVTIHQHVPMFHMEHCVFCAFLSQGTDYTNCGRPCDKHEVRLRDRVGAEHLLKADIGCRNTLFNALAQTGAEYVGNLLALGVRHFRVEFVNETPEQVTRTLANYRRLLRGEISGAQLWRELKLLNQLGVTRGSMDRP